MLRLAKGLTALAAAIAVLAGAMPVMGTVREASSGTEHFAYHYEVEETGSFPGDSITVEAMEGLRVKTLGAGRFEIINRDGESAVPGQMERMAVLGDGFYAIRDEKDDINSVGLVNSEGELLIPFEAANIERMPVGYYDGYHHSRYVVVSYSTDDNPNTGDGEPYFRSDDGRPFRGYYRVFDVTRGQFVEGFESTNTPLFDSLHSLDKNFLWEDDSVCHVMDSYGNEVYRLDRGEGLVEAWGKYMIRSDYALDSGGAVLDEYGNVLFSYNRDGRLGGLGMDHFCCDVSDSNEMRIYDRLGNCLLRGDFTVMGGNDEIVVLSDGGGIGDTVYLMDYDGAVLYEDTLRRNTEILELLPGLYVVRHGKEFNFISRNGTRSITIEDGIYSFYDSGVMLSDKGTNYYVFDSGEMEPLPGEPSLVLGMWKGCEGLLQYSNKSGVYTLFDTFSGKELLTGYKDYTLVGDTIYAFSGSSWTTYSLTLVDDMPKTSSVKGETVTAWLGTSAEEYDRSFSLDYERESLVKSGCVVETETGEKIDVMLNCPVSQAMEAGMEVSAEVLDTVLDPAGVSSSFEVSINGIDAFVIAGNPYGRSVSLSDAIISYVRMEGNQGEKIGYGGSVISEATYDQVLNAYSYLYRKDESTITYKTELSKDRGSEEDRVIAEQDYGEIVFSFDGEQLLSSIEFVIPDYLYSGLQDNVEDSRLFSMDLEDVPEAVEKRDRVVFSLETAYEEAEENIPDAMDPQTGKIKMDSNILFAFDSYELSEEGKAYLDSVLPVYLKVLMAEDVRSDISSIEISGHADTTGTFEYNQVLSEKRANAVLQYFMNSTDNGMTQEEKSTLYAMTMVVGRSFSDPVFDENGEVDMQASRRVEICFNINVGP